MHVNIITNKQNMCTSLHCMQMSFCYKNFFLNTNIMHSEVAHTINSFNSMQSIRIESVLKLANKNQIITLDTHYNYISMSRSLLLNVCILATVLSLLDLN